MATNDTQNTARKLVKGNINHREEDTTCPSCGETNEVRIMVGFPAAKCVNCGRNRA